ncbi:HET-domain-containing protein [Whalleya microplaca]|nr:HET-domain-containing protein [Whalleya microplaca]
MESFKGKSPHKPLHGDGTEIRIVKLLPNHFGAPIECELEHIALKPGADYEAVSYHWGDASITLPILLDGKTYPVTVNLFSGLKYLRSEDSPRRLWVDSLCINQTDTTERSREVKRMRDIYKFASDVLIWLGDYEPYTRIHVKRLFDFVRTLGDSKNFKTDATLISDLKYDELWHWQEELREFMTGRQWFERMWIIQEVSVRPQPRVKNLAIAPNLICGHLSLPFPYLREIQCYWSDPLYESQLALPPVCPTLTRLTSIWQGYQLVLERGYKSVPGQLAWLLSTAAATFKATNQRDVLYAMLGLVSAEDMPSLIEPDYSKSASQVLIDCATFIINESGLLDIIQCSSMQTKQLPSWVPDWQQTSRYYIKVDRKPYPGTYYKVLDMGKTLEVEMVSLAEVCAVGPKYEPPESAEYNISTIKDFFYSVEQSLNGLSFALKRRQEFRKVLWQLLLAFDLNTRQQDDLGWHLSIVEKDLPLYSRGTSSLHHDTIDEPIFNESFNKDTWNNLSQSIADKYLFKCTDSSVGIMIQSRIKPEIGDIICSIKGVYTMFVLRRNNDAYRVVGQCERSLDCVQSTMTDLGIQYWGRKFHLLSHFNELWETQKCQRIFLH